MPIRPATVDPSKQFQQFVQQQALAMRNGDVPPVSLDEWQQQRQQLRSKLSRAWGAFPAEACPLNPQKVGEFRRDGYRVEKLLLQTRPGIIMTANAYVPDGEGRRAAVLCVHGHWRLAKSEPTVQARCIGLAKLGFFVLMVDAFGAGERGLGKALGEYHGEMVAATLFPTGLALSGVQVYENMRAVDYLQTRSEVDPDRIGITGCSGGGNQTMYAGAFEERFKCVVPVCSVGTYQAYLSAACCMCEVVPGALSFTEEAGILSLVAPRALMIINATRDGFQFSIGEAKKSIAAAQPVFDLYDKGSHLKHATFDWKHDYHQPMREEMYGWMTKHLKGEGDGSPIPEPEIKTEEPETLRCFPNDSRPDDFVTLPKFAATTGRGILKNRPAPNHKEQWHADATLMRETLPRVLGLPRRTGNADPSSVSTPSFRFSPEQGVDIPVELQPAKDNSEGLCLLLDLDLGREAADSELGRSLAIANWQLATADLRATGETANASDKIGRAVDHNSAEWSMWIGQPLLGQWVQDVTQLINLLTAKTKQKNLSVVGVGPAGLVALAAAALDSRITRVAVVNSLVSYVSDQPYENQRLGTIVPGILRSVGDIPQLSSLVAPRRLVIAGGVNGAGVTQNAQQISDAYSWTKSAYKAENAEKNLQFCDGTDVNQIAKLID